MKTARLRKSAQRILFFSRWTEKVGLFFCLLSLCQPLFAQSTVAPEYSAKATFLANFPNFVDWPEQAFTNGSSPFLLCVVGDFLFGTTLAGITRAESVRGHRIEIRWAKKNQDLLPCNIVFVSRSEVRNYSKILELLRTSSVLTVGETPEFINAGGIMTFSVQKGNLQFDVNLQAAARAKLKISSRLLILAHQVINKPEDTSS
jgi:YfiR/HmsC-like